MVKHIRNRPATWAWRFGASPNATLSDDDELTEERENRGTADRGACEHRHPSDIPARRCGPGSRKFAHLCFSHHHPVASLDHWGEEPRWIGGTGQDRGDCWSRESASHRRMRASRGMRERTAPSVLAVTQREAGASFCKMCMIGESCTDTYVLGVL
ncbi:uncharacterized protein LY79DRAFT_25070 [Colletotrichum navitas]|uniref:Uncharacterized protein n=1 Tax=Colletotrichum navitas TaxID=681940 RepID=A0AAD8VCZ5_9PEZI|nr:uncharacterized protein LY79DRAFT_25070 [Colletotrichum navitas]KAK1600591.1 hypothetical protein LY79DRAFT_25070 [Colletotrichum navitas]